MTPRSVYVTWDDDGNETWLRCVWCGQQLTTEATRGRAYGPECASKAERMPGVFEARKLSARKSAKEAFALERQKAARRRTGLGEKRTGESAEARRSREEVWQDARARVHQLNRQRLGLSEEAGMYPGWCHHCELWQDVEQMPELVPWWAAGDAEDPEPSEPMKVCAGCEEEPLEFGIAVCQCSACQPQEPRLDWVCWSQTMAACVREGCRWEINAGCERHNVTARGGPYVDSSSVSQG